MSEHSRNDRSRTGDLYEGDGGHRAAGLGDRDDRPIQGGYGDQDRFFGFRPRDRDASAGQPLGQQVVQAAKRAFRGPKGYVRSDERIREDLSEQLAHQHEVDPSDIEVQVTDGEVTLSGFVQSRRDKFRVEDLADGVAGVREVHNRLRLRPERTPQGGTPKLSF